MTISEAFKQFLENSKVDNYEQINNRYKEITKKLNKTFRNTDSDSYNSLQVGSYGRYTGIKGISDLDMLYIMPKSKWCIYEHHPRKLLQDVRDALKDRYPATEIHFDRLVVDVFFTNFTYEVQPVFESEDGYLFPDTHYNNYRLTKPKQEQQAMTDFKKYHGGHHRLLCKMVRSWKNTVGLAMGGLLVDTLTYNFLKSNGCYDFATFSNFDIMCRDFFLFLKNEQRHDHYQALGSNQDVKVKHPFQNKAKQAYYTSLKAIAENNEVLRNKTWREIFGFAFPKELHTISSVQINSDITDLEEFIEDFYPIDIKYELKINCQMTCAGFRSDLLQNFLKSKRKIPHDYSLMFYIEKTDAPLGFEVRWKVRNVGDVAERRNCLRGQIIKSNNGFDKRKETSNFYGPHYVECYLIYKGVVVARDRIDVPIE